MPPEERDDKAVSIAFGDKSINIPIPPWARSGLAIVLIAASATALVLGALYLLKAGPFAEGKVAIDAHELAQLNEARRHLGETPDARVDVISAPSGKWGALHYSSDDCLFVFHAPSDPQAPAYGRFNRRPAEAVRPIELGDFNLTATPAFAGEPPTGCAHYGADYIERYEETGEKCWIRVWRDFVDGCQHYAMFNRCSNSFELDQNGTPRLTWTRCNH